MVIKIRVASARDRKSILDFYQESGYLGKPDTRDTLVVALREGAIIGVVRICWEDGFAVLRGVRVHPNWQRKGVGSNLVRQAMQIVEAKRDRLFVIPYQHLVAFYERLGFNLAFPEQVPQIIRSRYKKYRDMGYKVVVMWRAFSPCFPKSERSQERRDVM